MVTQAPSRAVVLITTLFALSCIGLILFVWNSLGGSSPLQPRGYRFDAVFSDASQLYSHADVRISGVNVGKVVAVKQVGLDTRATIELKPKFSPLPSDARALLRQKTLLGETFVALTPGSRTAPKLREGGTLASSQIEARQPLDRLLGALDPKTRQHLQDLLTGGSNALQGRGGDLNAALGDLDPVTAQLKTIAGILDRQGTNVRSLIRDTGTVLDTVAARDSDVQGLVRNGDSVLSATAQRNRAVTAMVARLPGLLGQLRTTMAGLDRTGMLATPALDALRPAAKDALPALQGLDALAPRATRLFRSFDDLIPTARRALPAAAAITDKLVPFTDVLYPAAQQVVPVIDLVRAYKGEITATMANLAAATQATSEGSDGKQRHYIRTLVPFTEEGLVGYEQRLGSNRHNPYPAPGTWKAIGREGLPASDCRNTSNAQTVPSAGSPPCRVQAPWTFGGKTAYFPQLEPAQSP